MLEGELKEVLQPNHREFLHTIRHCTDRMSLLITNILDMARLETDTARAFMRAYRKTRLYMNETPAAEIARAEKPFFPDIDEAVLADCIATYQRLGCWTPHVEITRPAYQATLDIFEFNGMLKERYRYEQVCCEPPSGD